MIGEGGQKIHPHWRHLFNYEGFRDGSIHNNRNILFPLEEAKCQKYDLNPAGFEPAILQI